MADLHRSSGIGLYLGRLHRPSARTPLSAGPKPGRCSPMIARALLHTLMLLALWLDYVWLGLWMEFTSGRLGCCNSTYIRMTMYSIPAIPVLWFGFQACHSAKAGDNIGSFPLRLPFVVLFAFTVGRLPVYILLTCWGKPPSEWSTRAAAMIWRVITHQWFDW